jgi:hypothetical protein
MPLGKFPAFAISDAESLGFCQRFRIRDWWFR